MTNGQYVLLFKILGKWARIYDMASADNVAETARAAVTIEQIADQNNLALDVLFAPGISTMAAQIANGATAQKATALAQAGLYLTSQTVLGYLALTGSQTPQTVLTALAAKMAAGEDNKTLTTKAATGLVNFFDTILVTPGTWNTAADISADYKDSVYVVDTLVV